MLNREEGLFSVATMTLRLLVLKGWPVLALLACAGCLPSTQSVADEEKETHFLKGKSCISTMDYKGAIESFEKALEINPRSGAAHFELGWLLDEREADPAAAIYHYEKYLKLRSDAANAEMVRQRISTCKQELAKNVSLGPLTERQQREVEALLQKNKALEEEIKRLNETVENWRSYAVRLQGATSSVSRAQAPVPPAVSNLSLSSTSRPSGGGTTQPISGRTHTVKAGETLTVIAKRYGVKVESLMTANPSINSRRLQVGQVLQVPNS